MKNINKTITLIFTALCAFACTDRPVDYEDFGETSDSGDETSGSEEEPFVPSVLNTFCTDVQCFYEIEEGVNLTFTPGCQFEPEFHKPQNELDFEGCGDNLNIPEDSMCITIEDYLICHVPQYLDDGSLTWVRVTSDCKYDDYNKLSPWGDYDDICGQKIEWSLPDYLDSAFCVSEETRCLGSLENFVFDLIPSCVLEDVEKQSVEQYCQNLNP